MIYKDKRFLKTWAIKIRAKNTAMHVGTIRDLYGHVATCRDKSRHVRTIRDMYGQVATCPYRRAKYNPTKITKVPTTSINPMTSPSNAPTNMAITGNKYVTYVAKTVLVRCNKWK